MRTYVLDACVLWASVERDILLSFAEFKMYQPVWSNIILEEVCRNEEYKLIKRYNQNPSTATERSVKLISEMRRAFPNAEIVLPKDWEVPNRLPDPNDEHVLEAAILSHADGIVTDNSQDFPNKALPLNCRKSTGARFVNDMVKNQPAYAYAAIVSMVNRYGKSGPPVSFQEITDTMKNTYNMNSAAEMLNKIYQAR